MTSVELTPAVRWLPCCYDLGDRHEHVSQYLLRGDDGHVLVENGAATHMEKLRDHLDRHVETLAAVVTTHSDLPHAGNLPNLREAFEDVTVVPGPVLAPELLGFPPDVVQCRAGSRHELAGRSLSFVDPPLADVMNSMWIFDHGSGVLFTGDGFGNYHEPGECGLTADRLDGGITVDDIVRFHADELHWVQYAAPERIDAAIRDVFEAYPVSVVAPAHGNPIPASSLDEYLDTFIDAVATIADSYDPDSTPHA